jgi:hypothetical protein
MVENLLEHLRLNFLCLITGRRMRTEVYILKRSMERAKFTSAAE